MPKIKKYECFSDIRNNQITIKIECQTPLETLVFMQNYLINCYRNELQKDDLSDVEILLFFDLIESFNDSTQVYKKKDITDLRKEFDKIKEILNAKKAVV